MSASKTMQNQLSTRDSSKLTHASQKPSLSLIAAAGTTQRRGSVLVLVVGVLALLGIIVAVYTTIGSADVRGGRALVRKVELDDQRQAIGRYISQVVADNASARFVERIRVNTGNDGVVDVAVRQAFDYPSTDPAARSQIDQVGPTNQTWNVNEFSALRFRADGGQRTIWPSTGTLVHTNDPRLPSDPWLSSIEPQWLNRTPDQAGGNTLPQINGQFLGNGLEFLRSQRDWLQMSVVSPDGRVVNLANLRGNFNARSGFTNFNAGGPYASLAGQPGAQPRISDNLFVWDRPAVAVWDGFELPPVPVRVINGDTYNRPMTWSSEQTETFRFASDWQRQLTGATNRLALGDVRHPDNLLADADGDGFYDSRWQELVDATVPTQPVDVVPSTIGARLFIAPKIIDLSGMVNVNTASTFSTPPTAIRPAGDTAADIDLERLLTMRDQRDYFGINLNNQTQFPNLATGAASFNGLSPAQLDGLGRAGFQGLVLSRLGGAVGRGGAGGLIFAENLVNTADGRTAILADGFNELPNRVQELIENGGNNNDRTLLPTVRNALYYVSSVRSDGTQVEGGNTGNVLISGSFGLADELELRAFGSVNDPATTSRLESAIDGRLAGSASIGPMRSSRSMSQERDLLTGQEAMAQRLAGARQVLTTVSGARPIRLSRQVLGPTDTLVAGLNSAVDLRLPSTLVGDVTSVITSEQIESIFSSVLDAISPLAELNGRRDQNGDVLIAVDPNQRAGQRRELAALAYGVQPYDTTSGNLEMQQAGSAGYAGPIMNISARAAAHIAVNATAMVSEDAWRGTDARGVSAQVHMSSRLAEPDVNDLPRSRDGVRVRVSGDSAEAQERAVRYRSGASGPDYPTMIVAHAITPQPFLAQAGVMSIYADSPQTNGRSDGKVEGAAGSSESVPDDELEWRVTRDDTTAPPRYEFQGIGATIRTAMEPSNTDFVTQVAAIRIHNPFPTPMVLGGATGTGGPGTIIPDYFVTWGGAMYPLAELTAAGTFTSVTINPHDTVTFYALPQDLATVEARFRAVDSAGGAGSSDIETWLRRQFESNLGGGGVRAAIRTAPINRFGENLAIAAAPPALYPNGEVFDSARLLTGTGASGTALIDSAPVNTEAVQLWKRRVDGTAAAEPQLLDRMMDSDGGDPAWERAALTQSVVRLPASVLPRPLIDPTDPNLNVRTDEALEQLLRNNTNDRTRSYTLTYWATVRRPSDPDWNIGRDRSAGYLPAWCVERKMGAGATVASANASGGPAWSRGPGIRDLPDFQGLVDRGEMVEFIADFGTNLLVDGNGARDPQWRVAVESWGGAAMPEVFDGVEKRTKPFSQARIAIANLQIPGANRATKLRAIGLLGVPAFGPWEEPYVRGSVTRQTWDSPTRFTTLSEAYALVSGLQYDSTQLADPTIRRQYEYALATSFPSGRLAIDRFVPYVDETFGSGQAGLFNQDNTESDRPVGSGIPLALNLADLYNPTGLGSLTSAVPGLININTAPLSVLRMLPLMAPNTQGNTWAKDTNWVRTASGGSDPLIANGKTWDIASTIVAYRDKLAVATRDAEGGGGRFFIDGSDRNDGQDTEDVLRTDAQADRQNRRDDNGRRQLTGIDGIAERRGFWSIGEVFASQVSDRSNESRLGTALTLEQQAGVSMDRLARPGAQADFVLNDPNTNDRMSVLENQARVDAGLTTTLTDSGATLPLGLSSSAAGYMDGRMALLDALLKTTTVRSDYFAAYFVVRGYTAADVEGLTAVNTTTPTAEPSVTSPMVPSIERRFVMVVDRSEVTSAGQQPKILLFQELPLK